MTTDNKTLADAQPGGRVRLGDGPTIEKQARELLAAEHRKCDRNTEADLVLAGDVTALGQIALNAIIAALSAQPSPGGQGNWRAMLSQYGEDDPREGSRSNGHDGVDHNDWVDHAEVPVDVLARIATALAARQPVGEPVGYIEHFVDKVSRMEMTVSGLHLGLGRHPVYSDPPAQAVDLGEEILRRLVAGKYIGTDGAMYQGIRALIDSQAVGK
ncbi:hypothetical protein I5U42_04860 [Stenotrophomonas maltophilia]|nr:hypothetical protein [Stenotrophomonas maltophilia]